MGGRLSKPRAADGLSEAPAKSNPASANAEPFLTRNKGIINGRTVMAPLAAFVMAGFLFVYTRTSIRAAKLNAQKHREADGGQISWHRESMRRHGTLERLDDDKSTFKEALLTDVTRKKKSPEISRAPAPEATTTGRSEEEDQLRKMMGKDKDA